MKRSILIFCILTFVVSGVLNAGDIKGKITAKGVKSAVNTVIYIYKIEGKTFAPPKDPVIIDQKNLEFIPHVQPILIGTVVKFRNSDDVLHNVFTPDACADKFNLGTWPKGETKEFKFESKCEATLLCNVHPEMEAYVLVLETPYFAVTDKDGNYVIKDVPPGKYTLKIWHEKLKGQEVAITVPEKGDLNQDFSIKR